MKSLRSVAVIGSFALLAGCVTATQTLGPDGRLSYVVNCPGVQHSMSDCYDKAGELCGAAGYSVVAEDSDVHAILKPADSGPMVNSSHRSLVVSCNAETPKDAPAPAPPAP